MLRRLMLARCLVLVVVGVRGRHRLRLPAARRAAASIRHARWNFADMPSRRASRARRCTAPLRLYPAVRPRGRARARLDGLRRGDAQARPGAAGRRRHGLRHRPARSWRQRHRTATSPTRAADDDLVDLVKATGIDKPGVQRSLIGSSGGGFVLRIAAGPEPACSTTMSPYRPTSPECPPTRRCPAVGPASRRRASSPCRCSTSWEFPGSGPAGAAFATKATAEATHAGLSSGWRRACSSAELARGAEPHRRADADRGRRQR